ncbi:MAG: hypothetical protein QM680_07365 [Luteolibacter sp.]
MSDSQTLPHPVQTAFVFAARYTHDRPTGGTLAVVRALEIVWDQLDDTTRRQILTEASEDAICNREDWQRLHEFAAQKQSGSLKEKL